MVPVKCSGSQFVLYLTSLSHFLVLFLAGLLFADGEGIEVFYLFTTFFMQRQPGPEFYNGREVQARP